jgi:hypothetical protein
VLPGSKYPPDVDPDFVPLLDFETRSAARKGHLLGPLRKASIERGADWARRTLVQGWNAHMYFHLGSRNETKALADTYYKWHLENRKLLRIKGKGDADPIDRAARHTQRQRNKAKKTAEVYEASQYRPLAMCYVPAYLDYGNPRLDDQRERNLKNLVFVRFPGCDVPHYYFWANQGEWENPEGGGTASSPLNGNEGWIRDDDDDDDDRLWEVVEVEEDGTCPSPTLSSGDEEDEEDEQNDEDHEGDMHNNMEEIRGGTAGEALYRRGSEVFTQSDTSADSILTWLAQSTPSSNSSNTAMSELKVGMAEVIESHEWEQTCLLDRAGTTSDACPFCCLRWAELTATVSKCIFVKRKGIMS